MRYSIVLAVIFAASCSHHKNQPPESEHAERCGPASAPCSDRFPHISGAIDLESSIGGAGGISGCRSSQFDAGETIARADKAFAQGHYDDAFGGYLASCDRSYPNACLRALEILDKELLSPPPIAGAHQALRGALEISAQRVPALERCEVFGS